MSSYSIYYLLKADYAFNACTVPTALQIVGTVGYLSFKRRDRGSNFSQDFSPTNFHLYIKLLLIIFLINFFFTLYIIKKIFQDNIYLHTYIY